MRARLWRKAIFSRGSENHLGGLGSAVAGDYAESPAKPQVLPDQLRLTYFVPVLLPVLPELEPGVVVELLPEPEPMPLDPGVVGLVVLPVELPVLPEAPLPALEPLRASRSHFSFSAPVRARHLLASLPDAPDAAPAEPELPDVELSLLPEDEPLADGVLELDGVLALLPELAPEDGEAEGVLAPPDAPAPVLPEDAPLLPLLEPEDCAKATPESARSAAAVAAVRVFNIMERSPSKGG